MKIGVRAHDFGRQTASNLAREIQNAGFEAVQLAMTKAIEGINSFDDITMDKVEQTRRGFEDNGVEITCYGCYIEPSLKDGDERQKHVNWFLEGIGYAKAIGAQIIATETTGFPLDGSTADREAAYARLKDSVLRMAEEAEKAGMNIGIEPVALHTLNTPELAARLLQEVNSPRLRIVFDPVNMLLPREDCVSAAGQNATYKHYIELLGDYVELMHIKDVALEEAQLAWRPIGQGVVDYAQISAWLKARKPDMRLLREDVRSSGQQDIAGIRNFLA